MATNLWTSDRRLYLDAAGHVVEATDPSRATLLVAAGQSLPLAQAEALGLLAPPQAEEKAKAPVINKALTPKPNKEG